MNEPDTLTKEVFIGILREAGLTEEQMKAFHRAFEKRAPALHQRFLENLHIDSGEIDKIRRM